VDLAPELGQVGPRLEAIDGHVLIVPREQLPKNCCVVENVGLHSQTCLWR
jgi:hypothetical protein